MHTLRAYADLLSAANSIDRLLPVAAAAGCDGEAVPLDRRTRHALGLDSPVTDVRIVSGDGTLRALLLVVGGGVSLREELPAIATRLARHAPHVLWLVIATQPCTDDVAIVAWPADRSPPRITALIANRARIVDSDAETLRALSGARSSTDLLTHARWTEILGREALGARFYKTLERLVRVLTASSPAGTQAARAEIALLYASRLLFLCFLEAKGWLDRDPAFLEHSFERCMLKGGRFHERVLRPLFFGTLNTRIRDRAPAARAFGRVPFLNGGLFARTRLERRTRGLAFSDEAYGQLIYDLFGQYRFTAREESVAWTEAAVDPEMLGRSFESLMAASERRRTGAFFTPFALVDRVTTAGLDAALETCPLHELTVLDPACGSGAFLVHALERIADRRAAMADAPVDISAIRRDALTRSIFGVDVNPTAVWLCELRLWLSVVIESSETDPATVLPLPNLDRNIRTGDALSTWSTPGNNSRASSLSRLRQRYATSSGPRKDALARQLDRAERERALASIDRELERLRERRRDLLLDRHARDLFGERVGQSSDAGRAARDFRRASAALRAQRRRISDGGALPFSFATHFADIVSRGGFALVIGNPPWVRAHHVATEQRKTFRREFEVAKHAAWEPGAGQAGAGRGFAAQVDVAALFVERSTKLLAPGGALSLLVPVKLWHSLAGGGVRRFIAHETTLRRIEDHSHGAAGFDAAVYPSLIVAQRAGDQQLRSEVHVSVARDSCPAFSWTTDASALPLDSTSGAPWILLPPQARTAFDRLRATTVTLAASPLGRPRLGVKCGCNDAFVVELLDEDGDVAHVRGATDERFLIERALLRPLLRGEHLHRWTIPSSSEHIVWTHDASGAILRTLPPHAARWFARWRRQLIGRSDARHRSRWWSLFRIDAARHDLPRVVWTDIGREPRASVLSAGDEAVPLNSCYVVRCPDLVDASAFAALLNGPVARAWLAALAEPARGGYHRYLGWTMSQLPIPSNWQRARVALAPLAERGRSSDPPTELELFETSLDAYEISRDVVAPLVAWLGA